MFAGILQFDSNNKSSEKLLQLNGSDSGLANIPFDDKAHWQSSFSGGQLTIVQQRRQNTHESKNEIGITSYEPALVRIVAWARIDNRKELQDKLKAQPDNLKQHDSGLILAAYLNWGEHCCEHLIGDFSFVIIDERQQTLFMGRDHLGVRPLYYSWHNNCLTFASSMAILNKLPALDLSPSKEWMAYYLTCFAKDWEITAYDKIKKCPPAHYIQFKEKSLSIQRYFRFCPENNLHLKNDEEYVEAYREQLHEAVICRLNSSHPIASESSGGLDSSSVTAIAAMRMPNAGKRLHAFGYDEGELTGQYILDISRRFPVSETHFFSRTLKRNPNVQDLFIETYGTPSEHPNSISHEPIYHAAEKYNIRTLLSGFGGDEFVTTEAPVALVEFWINHQYRLFYNRQRGNHLTKPLHTARWLYNFYRYNNHSISARGLMAMGEVGWALTPLLQEIIEKYPLHENMNRYIKYDGGKTRQNDFALENRWSPTITARFENCSLMAARYGIEYRWPLMDIRLLNLFLSAPSEQKLGPGQTGRYLHRRAVNGLLPHDITWKEKSMRKLSKWQKFVNMINRKLTEHKLRHLSKSTLQKWQQQENNNNTAVSTNSKRPFESLHPIVQPLVDERKINYLLEIVNNPQSKHEGERLAGQARFRNLQQLNKWLRQTYDSNNKTDSKVNSE